MFERCIYFNSNALVRKINARWEQAFARFGLSPSHGYLLRLVLEKPGLTQQAIADELRLDKSTVTRFINQLEEKKLAKRTVSAGDQREKTIVPTAKSRRLHDDLKDLGDELYSTMCKKLGKSNVKAFVASMREVAEKL